MFANLIYLTVALLPIGHEPPTAELILKRSDLLSPAGICQIIPLGKEYLCISTGDGEIKLFDRQKKQVINSEDSLKRLLKQPHYWIDAFIHHEDTLYALADEALYKYKLEWNDKSKPPKVGSVRLIDLKGEKVRSLLSAGDLAIIITDTWNIYSLSNSKIELKYLTNVKNLIKDNKPDNRYIKIWLSHNNNNNNNKDLLVYTEQRIMHYSFPDAKLQSEHRLPDSLYDAKLVGSKIYLLFSRELGIIDRDGSIKYTPLEYDYRQLLYIAGPRIMMLSVTYDDVTVFVSLDGVAGKKFNLGSSSEPYVEGNTWFIGFPAYNHKDEHVGGGYLREYELRYHSPKK